MKIPMSTILCLGTFRRKLATSGDTCEPDESPRDARNGLRREKAARFSKSPADLSAAVSPRQLLLVWSPLDDAARQSALQGAAATDLNQAVGSLERAIDRCWAHPQRAAGRAAAPRPQIRHDAAAAPGRLPTAHWLPSHGRAQASRHSCGRRRPKRRPTPHR